jgi:hypothetical protein
MKKILQAAALILIALCAILAAASSYPRITDRHHIQNGKELAADSAGSFKPRHSTDGFIYK